MKHCTRILLPTATAAALLLGAAGPAAADIANPHASCVGLALSDHAVNDGPGAIAQQHAWLRANAASFGYGSSGQVVRRWAKVHAGSHDPGCEAAIFEILATGP
jgi:hypothetical protein